jgi:hypothetical protein
MIAFDVVFDDAAFAAFIAEVDAALDPQQSAPIAEGLQEAGMALMDFERQHFVASSAGGGPWAPHAESTVRRTGPHPIFYGTEGRIYDAMFVEGADGHFEGIVADAFRFGAEGGSGEPTPSQLAVWHHNGTKTCPARPILIDPNPVTTRVAQILAVAINRAINSGGGGIPLGRAA